MGITSERHCEICNIGFPTELSLKEHRLSLMHHKILNHQLRSQGIVDPEHYCFLCQKSLFFSAWADHLLDRGHRQRLIIMKAEEDSNTAALHALAARSPWSPAVGAERPLSRTASTASLGESAPGAESFVTASEGRLSDCDWRPRRQPLRGGPGESQTLRLDRETELLIKKTRIMLEERLRLAQAEQRPLPGPELNPEAEDEDEMTPVTSLQSTGRSSDWPHQNHQANFDATTSTASSSSRTRARRRAARKLTRSASTSNVSGSTAKSLPIIEPVVKLSQRPGGAKADAPTAFEAMLRAEEKTTGTRPFEFGRNGGSGGFNFRLTEPSFCPETGSVVTRMQEALRLSKAEESARAEVTKCDERLDVLNARVEELLAQIANEEDTKERHRQEEMRLHSRRMDIIRSICAPRGREEALVEAGEDERSLCLGLESARSGSPLEALESGVQELQIGDQTRRDILCKVMERQLDLEEEECSVKEEVLRASIESSERSADTVRARTPVRTASLRRQRDSSLSAMMKEYLHEEPSSSDIDLDQTPRASDGLTRGRDDVTCSSAHSDLPSTAAEVFPGTINAHNGSAVLDLCVFKGYVYSAGEDCLIRKFSLQSHECLCEYRGHAKLVHCIVLNDEAKGGDRLYSGGFDCALFVFNVKTGREVQNFSFDSAVHALAICWSLLHIGLASGRLLTYSLFRRALHGPPRILSTRPITCLTAAPERDCLLAGADADGIRVLSHSGAILRHILSPSPDLLPLSALLCHGRVLTFHDSQLLCFNFETGDLVAELDLPSRISCLTLTASHLLLGTVCGRVHSVRSCRLLQEANICLETEEDAQTSAQLGSEAILTMTCYREALLVGDEKGRIIIRRL